MAEFKDCDGCTRASNNKYFNCPPRMSDGRHFTDYRPRCEGQYLAKIENNIPSSFDYRMYLTRNATDIMKKQALDAYISNRCGPCEEPFNVGTMLPEKTTQSCNTRTCKFVNNDDTGIGVGRQYFDPTEEAKFRQEFIGAKEQEMQYFKYNNNCCATAQDDMNYYPIDGLVQSEYERYSIPSGGIPMSGGDSMM